MANGQGTASSFAIDADETHRLEVPSPLVRVAGYDHSVVQRLRSELGLSRAMAAVLAARGFEDPESAKAFLHRGADVKPWPMGQRAAAEALAQAISLGSTIAVHGDYDCDGVCSTALLTRGLRHFGATVIPRVPERTEGYGLSTYAIDELAASGSSVLIAVDCGITSVDEIAHANGLGMTSLVVDHHRPRSDDVLPDALIVHPSLADPTATPMCAAGVAGVLIEELADILGKSTDGVGIHELQALATVTDLMPLDGINRSIVIRGLKALRATRNIGLSELMDGVGLNRTSINSRTLGFAIGPRINAAGRVRAAGAALELLLTEDRARASALAVELEAANIERRQIQQKTSYAAERMALDVADHAGWVLASPDWHKGVVGIVAGNLAGRFHRPTIVLAVEGEFATGSARSVPGYNVAAAIDACSHLLERHGGHAAAAGVTLKSELIDEFAQKFAEVVDQTLPDELRLPSVVADAIVGPGELTLELAEELELLEPVGEGNRAPLVSLTQVRCTQLRRMGDGKHGRFRVESATGSCSAVAFNLADRVEVPWGEQCTVAGRLEINRYNGAEEPRLVAERVVPFSPLVEDSDSSLSWIEELNLHFNDLSLEALDADVDLSEKSDGLERAFESTIGDDLGAVMHSLQLEGAVAVVVADADRRRSFVESISAGIKVVSWSTLEVDPDVLSGSSAVFMYDPPASQRQLEAVLSSAGGRVHQGWGPAQLRFTKKAIEHELQIEPRVRPFYAGLRAAIGKERDMVVSALRGSGESASPPRQVARMLCVLQELGALELDLETLEIRLTEPTMRLEQSRWLAAYRRELTRRMSFLESLPDADRRST